MSREQEWPPELDALQAAPLFHTLLFENDAVRVLDTKVSRGQTVPLHTHRWPSVLYILQWSDIVRRDSEGTIVADSRTAGNIPKWSTLWSEPLAPHTLENVGELDLHVLSVELKR